MACQAKCRRKVCVCRGLPRSSVPKMGSRACGLDNFVQEKGRPKPPSLSQLLLNQPRQEPGRYLAGIDVPSAVEPQRQPYRAWPTFVANTAVAAAVAIGTSVTNWLSIWLSLKPCACTFTPPSMLVVTAWTYLDVTLAF